MKDGKSLTVAWVGDSRAVLSRRGRAICLTNDHKASRDDEKSRVRKAGGTVDRSGRVGGTLAVSRSFGDFMHKGFSTRDLLALKSVGPDKTADKLLKSGIVTAYP